MREVAAAFLSDAQSWPASLESGVAHRIFGTTCWIQGDYSNARIHLAQALDAYEHARDKNLAARFGYDAGVMAGYWLAIVLWALGNVDEVSGLADRATALALQTKHLPTIAHAHWFTCFLAALSRKPGNTAVEAERMLSLGREHGLPLWLAHGTFYAGWARWRVGDRSGHEMMREGLSLLRQKDIRFCEPLPKALFAEAEAEHGRLDEGLALLDRQLEENNRTGQRWLDAELHRIRGELLLQRHPSDVSAAGCEFQQAIKIAAVQQTRTFGLRGALALAKHHHLAGEHEAARNLLLPAMSGLPTGGLLAEVAEANLLLQVVQHRTPTSEPTS